MCGDIHGAKTAFVKMSLPPSEKGFDEVRIIQDILKEFCGDDVSPCFSNILIGDGKITAKIFALMYDAGYTRWEELFANESAENITAMIENGLDDRTRKMLGTEEALKKVMAVCYIVYDETNYREQITKMQKVFDDMLKELRLP